MKCDICKKENKDIPYFKNKITGKIFCLHCSYDEKYSFENNLKYDPRDDYYFIEAENKRGKYD